MSDSSSPQVSVIIPVFNHARRLAICLQALEKQGFAVTYVGVGGDGTVDPDDVRQALRKDTALISIMYANNEVGTLQSIAELARAAQEREVLFHTDACQVVGKMPVDVKELGVDLLSLSGHKFHAPKGIGALYVRKGVRLGAFIHGGGQERKRRAGTSNVPGIVGIGRAAELAQSRMSDSGPRQFEMVEKLWQNLSSSIKSIRRNGHPEQRIPGILSVCIDGGEGEAYLMYLDMLHGIQASSGSACTTGSLDPSHVLLALGLPAEVAHGSIRLSLSHETTEDDISHVSEALPKVVDRVRSMSPTWNV